MTLPTFDRLITPLLQVLSQHPEGLRSREAVDLLADRLGISDEEKRELLPSGTQEVYRNRIHWAHDRLKRGGYSEAPIRGTWKITAKGTEFLRNNPSGFSDAERIELAFRIHNRTRLSPEKQEELAAAALEASPTEMIDASVKQIEDAVGEELLALMKRSTPAFFERLVVDLLVQMGYGARELILQSGGKSGDGGIDGVIALDRLGLEKVYIQAKRWQSDYCVGSPELQRFFGALAGRKAKKGVFITTSYFSREAVAFASQVSDSIVLVDGEMLAKLMIEYGVGVSVERTVKIVKLDSDYFDEV